MIAIVLVPGLLCSAEVFAPSALWRYGPVTVASTSEVKTLCAPLRHKGVRQ
jgi:hypothetical protein